MATNFLEDIEYLKSDDVGLVIAKGMALTYRAQPGNPVDFLAKYLLGHCKAQRKQILKEDEDLKKKELIEKNIHAKKAKEKELEEQRKLETQKKEEQLRFENKIKTSHDLTEELEQLATHLQEKTNSTAVYIGKIVKPTKKILEDSDDKAHLDEGAPDQIKFVHATKEHGYLVDKILKQDEGITFQNLFATPDDPPPEPADESEPKAEQLPKYIEREEVVRDPEMHYFNVPKLGSYMAIKLEYQSCLFEEAFDAALGDLLEIKAKRDAQAAEKRAFDAEHEEIRQQKAEDGDATYEPPAKEWEKIEAAPFKTRKVQYVVCLNTMGRDCKYSQEQKMFALRTVQAFRDRWEEVEKENLESDVYQKIDRSEYDKSYLANFRELDQVELDRIVEDAVANLPPPEGGEAPSEGEKSLSGLKARFLRLTTTFYAPNQAAQHKAKMERLGKEKLRSAGGERSQSGMSQKHSSARDDRSQFGTKDYQPLVPECWKEKLKEFQNVYIGKFPRIWQSLFYLLKFKSRKEICDKDTGKLNWKQTKALLNDDELFKSMADYWPFGSKEDKYLEYQKLKFIQANLSGITDQEVNDHSVALGKLFQWTKLGIDTRIEDIKLRRAEKRKLRAERKNAMEKEKERCEKRQTGMEESKTKFQTEIEAQMKEQEANGEEVDPNEVPEFEPEEFYARFDDENPPIEIPEEVDDDLDNDMNIVLEDNSSKEAQ